MLYSWLLYPVPKYSCRPKIKPYTHEAVTLQSSLLITLANTGQPSVSLDLPIPDISHKYNNVWPFCIWLLSLTVMFLRLVPVMFQNFILFMAEKAIMWINHVWGLHSSSTGGRLGCVSRVNSAAVNIQVRVLAWGPVFNSFEYITWSVREMSSLESPPRWYFLWLHTSLELSWGPFSCTPPPELPRTVPQVVHCLTPAGTIDLGHCILITTIPQQMEKKWLEKGVAFSNAINASCGLVVALVPIIHPIVPSTVALKLTEFTV